MYTCSRLYVNNSSPRPVFRVKYATRNNFAALCYFEFCQKKTDTTIRAIISKIN